VLLKVIASGGCNRSSQFYEGIKMAINHTHRTVVVGAFHNGADAQEAIRALRNANFTEDQIGLVTQDETGEYKTSIERGNHVVEGAATGLATGAGVGALWALGIAAGIMPVIGPVVAGGLLGSVLASAAGGAAIAGVVGALVGLGIPEEEAKYYDAEFRMGRTIVTVRDTSRAEEAWEIMHAHGAYNHDSTLAGTL
jgi:hypothetical protein